MDLQPEQVLKSRYEKGAKKDLIRQARQIGMFISRELLREEKTLKTGRVVNMPMRWETIGGYYFRSHASVIHGHSVVCSEIDINKSCRIIVTETLRLLEHVNEVGSVAISDYKREKKDSEVSEEIKSLLRSLNK